MVFDIYYVWAKDGPEHPLSFLQEEQINILTLMSLINSCNRVSINTKQTERESAQEKINREKDTSDKEDKGKNKWLQVFFRALKIINGLCSNFKLLHLHVFTLSAFWTTLGINEKYEKEKCLTYVPMQNTRKEIWKHPKMNVHVAADILETVNKD